MKVVNKHTMEHYFYRWGDYMRADISGGLGYPKIDIVYKDAVGCPEPLCADEPEGVKIAHEIYLGLDDPLKPPIWSKYVNRRRDKDGHKELELSIGVYRERLARAEGHIQGAMRFYKI